MTMRGTSRVIAGCVISSISDELREEISIKGVLFSRALLMRRSPPCTYVPFPFPKIYSPLKLVPGVGFGAGRLAEYDGGRVLSPFRPPSSDYL